MSQTDTRKIGAGIALLVVSTLLVFGPANFGGALPLALLTVGTLGLAVGALLLGTADRSRPV